MKDLNPSNAPGKTKAERQRIPMSVPVAKLEVPDIPGYHLHWFRNNAQRIAQAQRAGYEFVQDSEVHVNATGLGTSTAVSGNVDLGSHVSVIAGGTEDSGEPSKLVLMKLKEEHWKEDQAAMTARSDSVVDTLSHGLTGAASAADAGDVRNIPNVRYVGKSRTALPEMFRRK
jgi:hypothetical protein